MLKHRYLTMEGVLVGNSTKLRHIESIVDVCYCGKQIHPKLDVFHYYLYLTYVVTCLS